MPTPALSPPSPFGKGSNAAKAGTPDAEPSGPAVRRLRNPPHGRPFSSRPGSSGGRGYRYFRRKRKPLRPPAIRRCAGTVAAGLSAAGQGRQGACSTPFQIGRLSYPEESQQTDHGAGQMTRHVKSGPEGYAACDLDECSIRCRISASCTARSTPSRACLARRASVSPLRSPLSSLSRSSRLSATSRCLNSGSTRACQIVISDQRNFRASRTGLPSGRNLSFCGCRPVRKRGFARLRERVVASLRRSANVA